MENELEIESSIYIPSTSGKYISNNNVLIKLYCIAIPCNLYQLAFTGQRKASTRKDAISEDEKYLYKKAVHKHGNNWKRILNFMREKKDLLPPAVREKYNNDDANGIKAIRNRLANIGRKVK